MFMLLFAGCQQNTIEEFTDKDGNLVIREWYNESQIKAIKTFTNPEHTNYRYMVFYRDGILKDSAVFVNGKVTGVRKYYEASSGLLHLENYKNGLLNGPQKAVFSSGISSFEGFRKDNNKVGEWKFYHPNGKIITYEFYDTTGKLKYFRKFDQDGQTLKTDGAGLIDIGLQKNNFKLNAPVSGFALVAMPDGCSVSLKIEDMSSVNATTLYEKQVDKSHVQWEIKFDKPGEKKLKFTLQLTDDKTGEEELSVLEQLVNVEAN